MLPTDRIHQIIRCVRVFSWRENRNGPAERKAAGQLMHEISYLVCREDAVVTGGLLRQNVILQKVVEHYSLVRLSYNDTVGGSD